MKRVVQLVVILSLFVLSFPTSKSIAAPNDRWLYNSAGYARALELQRELNVPLVVYFYADWCPYCQRLDSDYLPAAPVQQYLRGVVKVRINPEDGRAEREIADRYGVRGYPSFFVMRSLASPPVKIHPFRSGGSLTAAEFASECEEAGGQVAGIGTLKRVSVAPVSATPNPPRPLVKAQIVQVAPSRPAPTFTNISLPELDTILSRYVAAIGGREAQSKITSRVSRGRVDVAGVSFGGKLEIYAKASNKFLATMNVEPVGVVKQGFDGRSAWSIAADRFEPAGIIHPDFYREIKVGELYARVRLVGKVKEGYRELYLVEAVTRAGIVENLYFDVESGLLLRRDTTRQTPGGPVRSEVYFSDWREVDGVKVPFRMTQSVADMQVTVTIEDVKNNVPVNEAVFRRP